MDAVKTYDSLKQSLLKTILALLVFQLIFISAMAFFFHIISYTTVLLLTLSIVIHIIILITLFYLKDLFIYTSNNQILSKINISNILSLFRVSSGPTLLFLFLSLNTASFPFIVVVVVFTIIVFLTDFIDGILARKLNQITKIGKYLDASCDYIILFLASFIFLWYNIISLWFFSLLLIRLLIVSVGNIIILLREGKVQAQTSFLGKASVFAVMVLFAFKILKVSYIIKNPVYFYEHFLVFMHNRIEAMVAGVLIVTMVEKLLIFRENAKRKIN
jgi:phosphatidylglycerophosphate synthase